MQLRIKLAAVVVTGAASVALIAGVPALASSHASTSSAITGPEIITGTIYGRQVLAKPPVIPLTWRGLVHTHSAVHLGGSGPQQGSVKTLGTPEGNLTVMVTSKPTHSRSFNPATCRFTFTQDIPLTVVGSKSTGSFADASGPAAAQVSFSVISPRFKTGPKKGQCNPRARPLAEGAVASFLASAVLTLR